VVICSKDEILKGHEADDGADYLEWKDGEKGEAEAIEE
jgi:hypothetical protein